MMDPQRFAALCGRLATVVLLGWPRGPSPAQQAGPVSGSTGARLSGHHPAVAVAVRAQPAPPHVDGSLRDAAWRTAPRHADFVQREPDQGLAPTEPTEFRVVYGDDALYIGVRAWDSRPGEISARLMRRDDFSPSDWIMIGIDSYRDRRTAFSFAVNPAGVKRDSYLYDDGHEDGNWDAVWDVDCRIDSLGWTAEFRIPFSQLRFTSAGEQVFGFQVVRLLNRLNEETHWRLMPREESGVVSLFGDLIGIHDVPPPRRAEILPYVSGTGLWNDESPDDPFRSGGDRALRAGVDLNTGVTSNFTLSATVNPDFGQVEADPAVVNLTAFETFLPEKRPFFGEGLDMFRFSLWGMEQLFYTRRIGRAPQGAPDPRGGFSQRIAETTIHMAAKLSGKTPDGWSVGLLDALSAEEQAQVVDSAGRAHRDPVEPLTNHLVGRLAKDFRGGLTQVGVLGTAVHRRLPPNLGWLRSSAYSLGLDLSHRWSNDAWSVSGLLVGSHVRGSPQAIDRTQTSSARYFQRPGNDHVRYDPTRISLSGVAAEFMIEKRRGEWIGATGFHTRSPGFEVNDAGYLRQSDYTRQFFGVRRRWLEPGKLFRRATLTFSQHSIFTYGWERTGLGGKVDASVQFLNYWNSYVEVEGGLQALSTGSLRGGPAIVRPPAFSASAGLFTDDRKPFWVGMSLFWRREATSGSWAREASLPLSWRPASNVDIRLTPELAYKYDSWQYLRTSMVADSSHYVFGALNTTTASLTVRMNATFTPNVSLQLYAEPFLSTGECVRLRTVRDPRAERFDDRFRDFTDDDLHVANGETWIDVDGDGAGDITVGQPDFRVLSVRSNVVLRWEYVLGSTLFLVWQHGRSEVNDDSRFHLLDGLGDLFHLPAENVLMLKANYWLSL